MIIPTPQTNDVLPGAAMPTMDEGALQAPNRAMQSIAAGVGSVANLAGNFAMAKQKADNVAALAEADRDMKVAYAEYQKRMAQEGNEEKWLDGWNKEAERISQRFASRDLAPAVRRQLNERYADWKANGDIQVSAAATQRSIMRNKAKLEESVEFDLENGNLESAVEKVRAGVEANLYSPEQAQDRISKMEARIDYYDAMSLAQDDPEAAYKLLEEKKDGKWVNFTNLSVAERNSLAAHSRREKGRAQSEFYSQLNIDSMRGGPIPVWQVEKYVEEGKLTSGQAASYIQSYHKPEADPFDTVAYAQLMRDVTAYDPAKDPFFEGYAELQGRMIGLPARAASELTKRLQARADQAGGTGSSRESKAFKLATDQIERLARAGVFQPPMEKRQKEPTREQLEIEATRILEMHDNLASIVAENPDASAAELWEKLLETPAGKATLRTKVTETMQMLDTPVVSRERKEEQNRLLMFRFYQNKYPSIRQGMTEREMVEAAIQDAGGSLTPNELRNLQQTIRKISQ